MSSATRVAVIGSGTMGNGIAQVAGMVGHDVHLYDISDEVLGRATTRIEDSLKRFVKSEKISEAQSKEYRQNIAATTDLKAAVGQADVVVEAIPEVLSLKQEVFSQIIDLAPANTLLATNTSQLPITAIGAALGKDCSRLVGLHFFNPPVLMRLIEIVRGIDTTDETVERAVKFSEGLGKETVICLKDSPGFITTRAYAALRIECLRMLEEGVATAGDIDKALRLGFNFPMGPFELADFNGLDIVSSVLGSLTETLGERFKPSVTFRNMISAGRYGRKTGEGFYKYD